MAQFHLQIAGRTALVHSLFESTRDYFRHYLTEEAPDFSVTVTRADLEFEQAELDAEARLEGFRRRKFTDPFLERAAIQRCFAEDLFDRDTLLFHGSAICVDGRGYLFTAKSGTGKSTHTRLWREVFGDRAVMINDDKPFLALRDGQVFLSGSPWSGKHGLDANLTVPLAGICILHRGKENRISPLSPDLALPRLLHECYRPLEEGKAPRLRELVTRLAQSVALWQMDCTKDPRAAEIAFRAMSQNTV